MSIPHVSPITAQEAAAALAALSASQPIVEDSTPQQQNSSSSMEIVLERLKRLQEIVHLESEATFIRQAITSTEHTLKILTSQCGKNGANRPYLDNGRLGLHFSISQLECDLSNITSKIGELKKSISEDSKNERTENERSQVKSQMTVKALVNFLKDHHILCGCPSNSNKDNDHDPNCKKPFSYRLLKNVVPSNLFDEYLAASPKTNPNQRLTRLTRKLNEQFGLERRRVDGPTNQTAQRIADFCLKTHSCACLTPCNNTDTACPRFSVKSLGNLLNNNNDLINELKYFNDRSRFTKKGMVKRVNELIFRANINKTKG